MATYRRVGQKWRAEIARLGVRKSGMFASKREAQEWAAKVEFSITHTPRKTLHDALQRYLDTVSIHKKGKRWETARIAVFKRQMPNRLLSAVTSDALSKWRDDRLKQVSTGTVRREMNLFANILEIATTEWEWLDANPFRKVKRPPDGRPRDRIISAVEAEEFVHECKSPIQKRVAAAFLFALETGMRAGEIVGIKQDQISEKFVTLPETKNGTARRVPLSLKARALLPVVGFELNSQQLDIHFRKVRDRLGADYTFHSTRHTAATRIGQSGKLSVFEFAAMFGWKDLKMAMRYCHSDTSDIADRL
jgi:integrase